MKLSEAMMLGDSMRTRANCYLVESADGYCGCALAGAQLAVGNTEPLGWSSEWSWTDGETISAADGFSPTTFEACIQFNHLGTPSFEGVMRGECTFEQLVDYVRSVEPACGECNRFECTCKVTGDSAATRCTDGDSRHSPSGDGENPGISLPTLAVRQ